MPVGPGCAASYQRSLAKLVFGVGCHLNHSYDIPGGDQLRADCSRALDTAREIEGAGGVH